jgi:hypothetical protein
MLLDKSFLSSSSIIRFVQQQEEVYEGITPPALYTWMELMMRLMSEGMALVHVYGMTTGERYGFSIQGRTPTKLSPVSLSLSLLEKSVPRELRTL